jgi:hypothetical protein
MSFEKETLISQRYIPPSEMVSLVGTPLSSSIAHSSTNEGGLEDLCILDKERRLSRSC